VGTFWISTLISISIADLDLITASPFLTNNKKSTKLQQVCYL
jgi:hypothetical protein